MKYIWLKRKSLLLSASLAFALAACVDGYKDEQAWSPSVKNTQLASPDAASIKIVFSPDGLTHEISWAVVLGAGGYEVTVDIVDNPLNPERIVDAQVVDGLSLTVPAKDDTRYKVLIKALGNATYNNKEALEPTERAYTNLLNTTATIPDGADLAEYFTTNPMPAECDSTLCYELAAGGTFYLRDTVNQKMSSLLIRGDKLQRAKLIVTGKGSFVNGGAGIKLQYMDIDYPESSDEPLIVMNPSFNALKKPLSTGSGGSGFLLVPATAPIVVQDCKITNMKYTLLSGGNQKYAIAALLIKGCVIGYNSATFNNGVFHSGYKSDDGNDVMTIKDATITNSTFYNEQVTSGGSNYLMRLQGRATNDVGTFPGGDVWAGGSLSITSCTFYQMGGSAQIANFRRNQWKTAGDKISVVKCVFVDSYNDDAADRTASTAIIRRIRGASANPGFTSDFNSYWYGGAFVTGETTHDLGDKSTTVIKTDPGLSFKGAGAEPLFTMSGADQIANRTGDPRWLPTE